MVWVDVVADQDQDKSEKATPFKLEEARKKGQVPKSMDTNSWVVVLIAYGVFAALGISMINGLLYVSQFLFSQSAAIDISVNNMTHLMIQTVSYGLGSIWPLWLALVVITCLIMLFQTGPIFSFFPVKPDIKRLSPIAGFKRLFSLRLLFESFKTFLKLLILIAVIWFCIIKQIPESIIMLDMGVEKVLNFLINQSQWLFICLVLSFIPIVLLDFVFSRRDFAKKMKMSKREVKDENKRRDGDPLIKNKRRQLQQELSSQLGSMGNLPKADIVITNPTHISVALKYDANTMSAPVVLAKGSGEYAFQIRKVARKNNVVVFENKPLARKLYRKVKVNEMIPPELFPAVAQIYIALRNGTLVK